jgi:RNA polymerase sigma factor (sigma-70 family)
VLEDIFFRQNFWRKALRRAYLPMKVRTPFLFFSERYKMYFEELVERISAKLRKITVKLNGRYTHLDENDLFQEALLHLWTYFQAGKLENKTESYILQGCYFHLKNYLRKIDKKTNLVSLDTSLDQEDTSWEEILYLENVKSFFDYFEMQDLLQRIRNNGLSKREKEILSFSLEGLTVREIGKKLGISHVMVIKLKKNLQRKLQSLL